MPMAMVVFRGTRFGGTAIVPDGMSIVVTHDPFAIQAMQRKTIVDPVRAARITGYALGYDLHPKAVSHVQDRPVKVQQNCQAIVSPVPISILIIR